MCTAPYLPSLRLERGLRPGFSLRWRWGSLPFPSRARYLAVLLLPSAFVQLTAYHLLPFSNKA